LRVLSLDTLIDCFEIFYHIPIFSLSETPLYRFSHVGPTAHASVVGGSSDNDRSANKLIDSIVKTGAATSHDTTPHATAAGSSVSKTTTGATVTKEAYMSVASAPMNVIADYRRLVSYRLNRIICQGASIVTRNDTLRHKAKSD
jgi:hypothetical protein